MRRYVVGFCFERGLGRLLLIRKSRPTWQRGRLNGVGGKVESGETAEEAMPREFAEETLGLVGRPDWTYYARLRCVDPDGQRGAEVSFFWSETDRTFPSNLDGQVVDGETLEVVDRSLIGEHVIPNLRYLVPMALNQAMELDRADHFLIFEFQQPETADREAPEPAESRAKVWKKAAADFRLSCTGEPGCEDRAVAYLEAGAEALCLRHLTASAFEQITMREEKTNAET